MLERGYGNVGDGPWCFCLWFFGGGRRGVGEFSDSCCMHIHNGIFTQVWMMF